MLEVIAKERYDRRLCIPFLTTFSEIVAYFNIVVLLYAKTTTEA